MVDSKELFRDLARRVGISDEVYDRLTPRGWVTQSGLAYAVLKQEQVDEGIVKPILGVPDSEDPAAVDGTAHPQASALRRLFFESYTAVMVALKRRAETTDATEPRKLSRAEKAHMRATFDSKSITGFKAKGMLDPSDAYLEKLLQMMETEDFDLKIMEWEKVTYQGAPLAKVAETSKSASGYWRESARFEPEPAVVGGHMSAYRLLHRRGIAWDMVGLCPFAEHERLIEFYWDMLDKDPPPNYARVTVEQVRAADFEVLKEVQRHVRRTGLLRTPNDTYPVADALIAARALQMVNQMLAPLPRASARTTAKSQDKKRSASASPSASSGQKRRKSKADPKKAAKKKEAKQNGVPDELSSNKNPDILRALPEKGGRFCFPFNLREGCKDAEPGTKCSRGWHLCPKVGCHQPHCYVTAHPSG